MTLTRRSNKSADPAVAKLGRRFADDPGDPMVKVTVRLDRETLAALKTLEQAAGPAVRGRRSVLLRRLILDAKAREALSNQKAPPTGTTTVDPT